jgi:hypothetical protein
MRKQAPGKRYTYRAVLVKHFSAHRMHIYAFPSSTLPSALTPSALPRRAGKYIVGIALSQITTATPIWRVLYRLFFG